MRAIKVCVALVLATATTLETAQAPSIVLELGAPAAITTVDHQDISRLLEASPKPAWLWTIDAAKPAASGCAGLCRARRGTGEPAARQRDDHPRAAVAH